MKTYYAFVLTMPRVGSWNGKWSGEKDFYAKVESFKKPLETLKPGNYYYNFGDGWGANVAVKEVSRTEAVMIKKKSKGFCNYDWMVDSLIKYGGIKPKDSENE